TAPAPAVPRVIEEDDNEVVVRNPGIESVLHERVRVCAALEPAVRPRPAEDVAQRSVLAGRADDCVATRMVERPVLDVDASPDAQVHRDQVDAIDVEGLLVLVEVVMAEHAIDEEFLHLAVVSGLVAGGEAIAHDSDVDLRPRWPG